MLLTPPAQHRLPWDWERKRALILAREDNVIAWATPLGFTRAMDLDASKPGLSQSLELEALGYTQNEDGEWNMIIANRELPPIDVELRENGIKATSLSARVNADGDDETTLASQLAEQDDDRFDMDGNPLVYNIPDRREQWWHEEEWYRWNCGPVIRTKFFVVEDKRNVRIVDAQGMARDAQNTLLAQIIADARRDDSLPTIEQLLNPQELAGRMAFYGADWRYSLLTPDELLGLRQRRAVNDWLNAMDIDPMRNAFIDADQVEENSNFNSAGDLGLDFGGTEGEIGIDDVRRMFTAPSVIGYTDDMDDIDPVVEAAFLSGDIWVD